MKQVIIRTLIVLTSPLWVILLCLWMILWAFWYAAQATYWWIRGDI